MNEQLSDNVFKCKYEKSSEAETRGRLVQSHDMSCNHIVTHRETCLEEKGEIYSDNNCCTEK